MKINRGDNMFGLDLQQFIEDNVTFTNEGGWRPNQDIYYNIEDDKFWIHRYCGNELLSPGTEKDNILLWKIHNTDEFYILCENCDGIENKREDNCPLWQECQAQSLYEDIQDHKYDDLWGGNGIYYQIKEHITADIEELAEVDLAISYEYDNIATYLNKTNNSTLEMELYDQIIDNTICYGFNMPLDNTHLDGHIEYIAQRYVDCRDLHEEIDEKLIKVCELLREYKIKEALKLLKE